MRQNRIPPTSADTIIEIPDGAFTTSNITINTAIITKKYNNSI